MTTRALPDRPDYPRGSRSTFWQSTRRFMLRRIWLPSLLYHALPLLYLASGLGCLAGGLYLPERAWPLPYLLLLGLTCIHVAWRVAAARRRFRLGQHLQARRARAPGTASAPHSLPTPV